MAACAVRTAGCDAGTPAVRGRRREAFLSRTETPFAARTARTLTTAQRANGSRHLCLGGLRAAMSAEKIAEEIEVALELFLA